MTIFIKKLLIFYNFQVKLSKRGFMSNNIETLDYIDYSLDTYLKLKKVFQEQCLTLQLFAVGHSDDFRMNVNVKQNKDGKIKDVKIKEKETINLAEIIPQGSKIICFNEQMLGNLHKKGILSLRYWLNQGLFPLYEDDTIDYELFLNEELIQSDKKQMKNLDINIKELREKGYVLKNSLMTLKISISKYGKTRSEIEKLSYMESPESTKKYLYHLTDKKNVQIELTKLVQAEKFDRLKERLDLFNIKTNEVNKENVSVLFNEIPTNYDYDFEYVVDIEGISTHLGGDYSNNYLFEMDYRMANVRIEQLNDFFNEKLMKTAKK